MPRPEPDRTKDVFLLGCGRTMLDLSPEEVAYINRADCVLALNKFILYHDVVGIVPTHVWFTEFHHPGPALLHYILNYCRREGLEGLTYVLHVSSGTFHENPFIYWKNRIIRKVRRLDHWRLHRLPRRSRVEFVRLNHWLQGGEWASSLDQPLFHLRTSFTCALNYLAIRHPGATIKLIGTDFNSRGYFFDEQINRHKFDFSDWTSQSQLEHGKHFAAIEYEGKTVFDAFAEMRDHLDAAGIRLVCNNPDSEVVRRGLAAHGSILPGRETLSLARESS